MAEPEVMEAHPIPSRRSHPLAEAVRNPATVAATVDDEDPVEVPNEVPIEDPIEASTSLEPSSAPSSTESRTSGMTEGTSSNYAGRFSSMQSSDFSQMRFSQASTILDPFDGPDPLPPGDPKPSDDPGSVIALRIAVRDLVTDLLPADTHLLEGIFEHLPAFAGKYGSCFSKVITENLAGLEESVSRKFLKEFVATADMEAALRTIDVYARDPDDLQKKLLFFEESPEVRMADPRFKIGRSARKAAKYGEAEMTRLKKEEEEKEKTIKEKLLFLQNLIRRSEHLVETSEQVADCGCGSSSEELDVAQAALKEVLLHDAETKRALYAFTHKNN